MPLSVLEKNAGEVPSPGALLWWRMAVECPDEFMKKVATKLLPSRAQLDSMQGFGGGSGLATAALAIAHLEQFHRELESSGEHGIVDRGGGNGDGIGRIGSDNVSG